MEEHGVDRDPRLKSFPYSTIGYHFSIVNGIEEKIEAKPIKLITAACKNMGIGFKGNLPWNLPKEFNYLLDTITTVTEPGKKNLLMWGRTSFESFPESLLPLRNTVVAVLSRSLSSVPNHAAFICHNVGEVLKLASTPPLCHDIETVWVLGGVQSYMETLQHPWCDSIYFTNILADFECDTFFPQFDKDVFSDISMFRAKTNHIPPHREGNPMETMPDGLLIAFKPYELGEIQSNYAGVKAVILIDL